MEDRYSVGNFIYDPKNYDGLNTHQDDIEFYKQWIDEFKVTKILELCCGTGRITISLAQSGLNITGLDLNEEMLGEAKRKAKKENLNITFIKGDMRNFTMNEKFPMILIPFNSIHCLYENDDFISTLKTVYNHLEDNGYFMIDYFNPDLNYLIPRKDKPQKIADYETEDGRRIVINQTLDYDDHTQVNRIKWEHVIDGESRTVESLDMRIYFPQELDHYLTSSGFQIIDKYGDYQRNRFSKRSPKQLIVCQKK